MLAILQHQPGNADTLFLGKAAEPVPGENDLLVAVRAVGVNRADIQQREGHYPPPPGASALLGLEIAGEVMHAPSGSTFHRGDAVFGLISGGGYAERALLPQHCALRKPDWMSWAQAVSLPEAWMTAWYNLIDHAAIQRGETILIHAGASGVGAAAIQLAKHIGARVIASAGNEDKLEFCRRLGADLAYNYHTQLDATAWLRKQGGIDVILDPTGAGHFEQNILVLRPDGRLVCIGLLGGTHASLDLGRLLMKRLSIIGSTLRSQPAVVKMRLAQALQDLIPAFDSGDLCITLDRVFDWRDVAAAHHYMEANRNSGKIVLDVPVL